MTATRDQLISALRSVVRPCPPAAGNFYMCRGDDDPTVGVGCHDPLCQNPAHESRRPCTNPWHRLDVEVRDELR